LSRIQCLVLPIDVSVICCADIEPIGHYCKVKIIRGLSSFRVTDGFLSKILINIETTLENPRI